MFIILYIQCTQFFVVVGQFYSQIIESANVIHSISKPSKACSQFCILNIQNFSKM